MVPSFSADYTDVYGTVKNLTGAARDYDIEMLGSNGEAGDGYAFEVLPGQTAVWFAQFTGGAVTPQVLRVVSYVVDAAPVDGEVAITYASLSPSGQYFDVNGTVRNTGTATASYSVELLADNTGEAATGYAFDVLPGQTATWTTSFRGLANVHWVRTTSS